MKLQKQLSRKVGDVKYAKWVLVIPPNIIEELKWKEGQELEKLFGLCKFKKSANEIIKEIKEGYDD